MISQHCTAQLGSTSTTELVPSPSSLALLIKAAMGAGDEGGRGAGDD